MPSEVTLTLPMIFNDSGLESYYNSFQIRSIPRKPLLCSQVAHVRMANRVGQG
jgi:hypothetical protein